jgi:hypothetical protein
MTPFRTRAMIDTFCAYPDARPGKPPRLAGEGR